MSALILRATKGSNLTPTEADSNYILQPVTASAGRAIVAADNGSTLNYTGSGAGAFTLATGFGSAPGFKVRIVKGAAGGPTLTVAAGVTLNGVNNGAISVVDPYAYLEIEATALDTFRGIFVGGDGWATITSSAGRALAATDHLKIIEHTGAEATATYTLPTGLSIRCKMRKGSAHGAAALVVTANSGVKINNVDSASYSVSTPIGSMLIERMNTTDEYAVE